MTPYYEHAGITIYHGDCLRVLEHLAPHYGERHSDLLLTDPPYGIGADRNLRANKQHGKAVAPSADYGAADWDAAPSHEAVACARSVCRHQIVFGGNGYPEVLVGRRLKVV